MHSYSCAREASRRLALTLTDVLHRQTAENSRIHLDQRLHLEKMSAEETLRIHCRKEGESQEDNKGQKGRRGEKGQKCIIK